MKNEGKTTQGMSIAERLAAVHFAAKTRQLSIMRVVKEHWGSSYSHARLCLHNKRAPSQKLAEKIADFVGISVKEFWGRDTFNEPYLPARKKKKKL